jgi:hypothetical protein
MRNPYEKLGLVFDIDDTIVPSGALTVESERVQNAFRNRRMGTLAIPASARPAETTLAVARHLDIDGLAIAAGGALIVDIQTGESDTEWERVLTPGEVDEVIARCYDANYHMRILGMAHDESPRPAREQKAARATIAYALAIPTGPARTILESLTDSGIHALLTPTPQSDMERFDLTVRHPEAQKHIALQRVCCKYSIRASQLVAIGDGLADIGLFHEAGYSYAMGNAHPAVKEAADAITAPCDEDGAAQVIERLFID